MEDTGHIVEGLLKSGAPGHVVCNALQFVFWYNALASETVSDEVMTSKMLES